MTTTSAFDDHDLRVALTDASLDAPRVDLWGRLQAPARDVARARIRRPAAPGLRAMAAVLAIMLVSAAALAVASSARPQSRAAKGTVTVPDTLLLTTYDQNTQTQRLQAVMPGTNELREALDGGSVDGAPLISPDGAQLYFTQREQSGDQVSYALFALTSDTLAPLWKTTVATQPASDARDNAYQVSVAVAGDRVYAVAYQWNGSDSATLVAYGRADGREQGRWPLDFGARYVTGVQVKASLDGQQLYVIGWASDARPSQGGNDAGRTAFRRYRLPAMTLEQQTTPAADATAPFGALGGQTPDGKTFYSIGWINNAAGIGVNFFDVASGMPAPAIELDGGADSGFLYQHAFSPDGTRLYLFNPQDGSLSIVDLVNRQLLQTVQVDMSRAQGHGRSIFARAWDAVRGVFAPDAAAKVYFQGTMQLSPDGSRLYAIGVAGGGIEGSPDGVLVIDTRNWQVLAKWATDMAPVQLEQSADGRYLYVYSPPGYANSTTTGLALLDTANGATLGMVDLGSGNSFANFYSLADIYRDSWGKAPAVAGAGDVRAASFPASTPFARLDVATDRTTIIAGDTITVTARYLDPTSDDVVRKGSTGVRYTPPDSIRAVFSKGNADTGDDVTVVLTPDGYGTFRGSGLLTGPGAWTLRVQAETAGEPNRSWALTGGVTVQAAFQGSDGRRYMLRVVANPAEPAANQDITVSVAFVDAATGAPLPDGVDIAGGLPPSMEGSFFGQGGVTSAQLLPDGHGVYAGSIRLWASGPWRTLVNFRNDGATANSVEVGTIVAR